MAQGKKDQGPAIMTEKDVAKSLGAEIDIQRPQFDNAALSAMESWDELASIFEAADVAVEMADKVLGDGFTILAAESKHELIGKPMALVEWRFNKGTQGRFVSIRAVVKTGDLPTDIRKVIINDGSTGIMQQLDSFTTQTGKQAGLLVKKGLRVSEYTYEDPKSGVQKPAKTYYLDASA